MKICWDNTERVELSSKGDLTIGKDLYIEKEACKFCGESYLTLKHSPSNFCCVHHAKIINLVGRVFDRWTVMNYAYTENGVVYWKCKCDCGVIKAVTGGNLKSGTSTSCGCYKLEIVGENHHNYNPNLTDEDRADRRGLPKYKEWRKCVYKLDNYTCQKCGDNKGGNLNAHHILSYRANPEVKTEVSNGITLCESCHKDFHHQYGYGDNDRAQLIEFIKGEYYGS